MSETTSPETEGPHMVQKVSLEDLHDPFNANQLKDLGMTALIVDPEIVLDRPDGTILIETSRAGTVTPKGKTPPYTLILDVNRCEMQSTRLNPNQDLSTQMQPLEDQGWEFSLPGSGDFIDFEHVGNDGMISAIMVRPLQSQAK
jgi:hypothetical protein